MLGLASFWLVISIFIVNAMVFIETMVELVQDDFCYELWKLPNMILLAMMTKIMLFSSSQTKKMYYYNSKNVHLSVLKMLKLTQTDSDFFWIAFEEEQEKTFY